MDFLRGNGSVATVILVVAVASAMLIISSCHEPFARFTVRLKEKPVIKKIVVVQKEKLRKKKKKLLLTFDDGPNKGTRNVLHIVQDEKVPVSFFIVGEHAFASAAQQQMWDSLQA